VLDAILKAPVATLPAFAGIDLGAQGYVVAKITKLWGRDPSVSDPVKAQSQYAAVWGDAVAQAYYAALKSRFKVTTNEAALTAAATDNASR
jgi:peptidyl-prolyl cis-trans isomerase D